ncbi:MAG: hypothetical protein Kow00102_03170 [Spirochaetota bacterium]|nr:hypothetical protein [Spirochaetota bacterium]
MKNHELIKELTETALRTRERYSVNNINTLEELKAFIIFKYKKISNASKQFGVDYTLLCQTLSGLKRNIYIINTLQTELCLTDEQVLQLWPLLKTWPKNKKSA